MRILHQEEDGWIGVSYLEGLPFLHMEYKGKWSVGVYKRFLQIFVKCLKEIEGDVVFSTVKPNTRKFNEVFGFESIGVIEGHEIMRIKK